MLVAAAIGCITAYVFINHIICSNDACDMLRISKIWVTLSPVFAGYGVLLLFAVRFFYKETDLASIYFDVLVALLLLGAMIICLLPFTVLYEVNGHT